MFADWLDGLRDAIADQGGDPAKVNPVVPVQLIVDHSLAVWNALVRYPGQRCVLWGEEDVVFAAPRRISHSSTAWRAP